MIITISEDKWNELLENIRNGIIKELQSSKQLVDIDKEVAARSLYLRRRRIWILVKESKVNNQYEIDIEWFERPKAHKYKFPKAFDYLQQYKHDQCIVLTEGDFVISDFYWRDFWVGLLADFQARLSIFYTDYKRMGNNYMGVKRFQMSIRTCLKMPLKNLNRS
ncbi:MAG TPA: hypothetical protein VE226_02135 [Nitrososphaeraceae archaeon]|nr:hypothetical protein [Nitrososphaeraceae archaeon]